MNRTQRTRNRQDYTPQVRATRPPTSPHLSEIKRKYVTMVDTATATELIAAVTDRKIRIVRIKIVRQSGTGSAHLELYFGTAADISTADSNGDAIIDLLRMDTSEDGLTRTYGEHDGPTGALSQRATYRWIVAPTGITHWVIIEYREVR